MNRRALPGRALAWIIAVGLVAGLAGAGAGAAPAAAQPPPEDKIEGLLRGEFSRQATATFWVKMGDRADLSAARTIDGWREQGEFVTDRLADKAQRSQAGVLDVVEAAGVPQRSFWVSNLVEVEGTEQLAEQLAHRSDVAGIYALRTFSLPPEPTTATDANAVLGVPWNIGEIRAPDVWSTFDVKGDGVVVANIDTGVQWDHPALRASYRGNAGGTVDHDYNWFDPSRVCGDPSLAPCDSVGHGTHTMGTMVGDDGAGNQVGVEPAARWIAARGCESNRCSDVAILTSMQWMLAPTDLDGANPRPDLRPNIVNNSWGGPGGSFWLHDVIDAWLAAGISARAASTPWPRSRPLLADRTGGCRER
jgi:subtilisin family serine protease